SLFHDGRSPLLLQGQPVLGRGAEGEHSRTSVVRVLLVHAESAGQCRRAQLCRDDYGSAAAIHHSHSVDTARAYHQVTAKPTTDERLTTADRHGDGGNCSQPQSTAL